jgi:hypothetical protein
MDIPRALEQELKRSMEDLLKADKESGIVGGRSTVILFIPRDVVNLNNNDLTIAKENIKHFREYLPGLYVKMSLRVCKLTATSCSVSTDTAAPSVIHKNVTFPCLPFPTVNLTEKPQRYYELYYIPLPICTVAMPITAMCKYRGRVFVCDLNPHSQSYMSKLWFLNLSVIPSFKD